MKISDDQNTITLDDGRTLTADFIETSCAQCDLHGHPDCGIAPCISDDRPDGRGVTFKFAPKVDQLAEALDHLAKMLAIAEVEYESKDIDALEQARAFLKQNGKA